MVDARELLREGRKAEALTAARTAYEAAPDDLDGQLVLGLAAAVNGEAQLANAMLGAALTGLGAAGEARHWRVLAQVRNHLRDLEGEVLALREAAAREPGDPVGLLRLAAALVDLDRCNEALAPLRAALDLANTNQARRLCLLALRRAGGGGEATDLIRRALAEGWGRSEDIAPLALRLYWAGVANLLPAILRAGPLMDPHLERVLTGYRRDLLLGRADGSLELRAALAIQGFINEYAWAISPEEWTALEGLAPDTPESLLLIGAYRGLEDTPGAETWLSGDTPEPVRCVLDQQITEVRAARAAAAVIPALTAVRPGVSEAVQAQYEINPYPRWTTAASQDPAPLDVVMRAQFPAAILEPIPNAAAPAILVAGCGTGRHAIETAQRYSGANVLAVDISRASLGYAQRRAEALCVANLRFAQADLLDLGGMAFDVIECAGVLHHLGDPMAGMAALTALLRPNGLFFLGLYSAPARKRLAAAQALARRFPHDAGGLRKLRQAVMSSPADDPVRMATASGDFYSLSACRDLLAHVQEHVFDMDGLRAMIEGYRPLGFAIAPEVLAAYRARNADDPAACDLARWADFEREHPRTFAGMYQLWLQKSG